MQVRAASGASGALLLLDFRQEQLCVAQVGPYHHAVLGRLYGGMAVQRAEAQVLGQADGLHRQSSCLGMGMRKTKALAGELKCGAAQKLSAWSLEMWSACAVQQVSGRRLMQPAA